MHEFEWRPLSAFQCQTVLTVVLVLLGSRHRSQLRSICVYDTVYNVDTLGSDHISGKSA